MLAVKIHNLFSQADVMNITSADLPVFATEGYLKSKSSLFGWLVSDSFILPYIIDRRLVFKRLVFTSSPINIHGENSLDEALFLQEAIKKLKEENICDFISKAQSNSVFKNVPNGLNTVPWGTYVLDLHQSKEQLISNYHKKHRNVIKKAEKSGVSVVFDDSIDVIYYNIKQTLDRQKSPYFPSIDFLNKLHKNIPNNVLFASAYYEGKLQGTAVVLFDSNCGYYLYGGSIPKPLTGSVNYLQHCIILHLQNLGVTKYDFVGARIHVQPNSKFEGIQRFKSRFGCNLVEGYAFNVIFSPVKFKLFNIAVKLYLKFKGIKYCDPIEQLIKESKIK